jgi:transposase
MIDECNLQERILEVLRPFASTWTGSLRRGDLVIPQTDVARVVNEIVDLVKGVANDSPEAPERVVFDALRTSRRLPSVQDQAKLLRERFLILDRARR